MHKRGEGVDGVGTFPYLYFVLVNSERPHVATNARQNHAL